jgi:hypothetical protein
MPKPPDPDAGNAEDGPRVLTWALVKRIDPRLPNTWGHWWIELGGEESYGWWPTPCPMGWKGAMLGSNGCLNGIGTGNGGTPSRDAYHGEESDHWFHPTLVAEKSDDQVRAEIRAFARNHVGGFCWQWPWLRQRECNCRTFQQEMFAAVGLVEKPQYLYTRGPGCPFMYPFRSVKWRTVDALADTIAWLRSRFPVGRRRARRDDAPGRAEHNDRLEQRSGAASLPLTDPRGRAQAQARGVLVAESTDA